MESQPLDYWLAQGNMALKESFYDMPIDLTTVPSLSNSPTSSTWDSPMPYYNNNSTFGRLTQSEDMSNFPYNLPLTPQDYSSPEETPFTSPRTQTIDLSSSYPESNTSSTGRTHATSGRRRAQNRAAQRAFRERKEKHARDLEEQLKAMTDKYRTLEANHAELGAAYEKLRKTVELLATSEEGISRTNADTLKKVLEILHGASKIKREVL